ncbi:MAG: Type 1 glutamine amidotransferase-like domain-containing protein [Patescibacteria group bacterium]|jgi:dipeptidase E
MRILLTSNGFPEGATTITNKFFELVGKQPSDTKVAFIPTASVVEEDRSFMVNDRARLEAIGIPVENIINLELDHPITLDELKKFDVIFLDGGNTFYLLEKMRESGFDKTIAEYISQDLGVFVGVSAGSIVMGPDIGFAEPWDDKTKGHLENTKGLGYTKEAYSPHYSKEKDDIILEQLKDVGYKINPLYDGEAVLVTETEEKVIR